MFYMSNNHDILQFLSCLFSLISYWKNDQALIGENWIGTRLNYNPICQ